MTQMPSIDGVISPGEWASATDVKAQFHDIESGVPFGAPVEFWLASSRDGVCFAARIHGNPGALQSDEYRQNVSLDSNDHMELAIDPFAKGTGFNGFRVNPAGANQLLIAGGRAPKTEWMGSIRTAAHATADGWECEMYVPWQIMDLPSQGRREVLVNVIWSERRTQRKGIWFFNNRDGSRTPRWTGVEIPETPGGRTLNLLPFAYAGISGENSGRDQGAIVNGGLDFKTALNRRSQLVGTINPDFRNIENQVLSLDFSYFERLAGESRPFFLEGQGARGGGMGTRLFASQRIRDLDAGINTYGSLDDKSTFALLGAADFGHSGAMVASYNRRVGKKTDLSTGVVAGGIDGSDSLSARLGVGQQMGDWRADAYGAVTDDDEAGTGSHLSANFSHASPNEFFNAGYEQVTPGFFPRLGFAPETDYRSGYAFYSFEKVHPRGGIMETEINGNVACSYRFGGELYRKSARLNTSVTWKNGLDFDTSTFTEYINGQVDQGIFAGLELPRGNSYRRWSVDVGMANLAGHSYVSRAISLRYRPLKRVQTYLSSQWISHFEEQRQIIFSLNWDKGQFESVGGRLVERDGKINWYLSWRKSGGPGTEFFVVLGDPNAEVFRKQLILKVVYPLSISF